MKVETQHTKNYRMLQKNTSKKKVHSVINAYIGKQKYIK